MSDKKVLIAYGTRFGSTEEVAEKMKGIFENTGLITDLVNLKEVSESNWPSLKDYNGVLLGSSIKIGRGMKEPTAFLKKILISSKGNYHLEFMFALLMQLTLKNV